ncbi:hypothetical protein B0H19DRAFT_1108552 [Mycena capillaripes]|nr:hypothetical protein B0H19DRAFT_1108552 [Mycena capillaripes]
MLRRKAVKLCWVVSTRCSTSCRGFNFLTVRHAPVLSQLCAAKTLTTMTTISGSGATPVAYAHPYIVCHDASSKALSLWTCTGELQPHASLEGEASSKARSYIVAPDRIVTESGDGTASTILVHSLPDGQLLDAHALGSGPVYISQEGLIAKWDEERARPEVYGLAENGKLTVLGDLNSPVEETVNFPSDIPQGVYLTAEAFVQSQVRYRDPTVHLTRLSSAPPRRASFGLTRAPPDGIPGVVMNSMLVDAVPIPSPSSPSFVMAHVEQVLDFNEDYPQTALRSIDPQTLALGWCTLIDQRTEWLRYSAATGAVVAYGWMGIEQDTGVIVLDATTGTVLRAERIGKPREKCGALGAGVHCDLTPAGDALVVVFGDGQLVVAPLGTFVANGFVREGDSDLLVTIPCPEFPLSTPKNSKERRSKANGAWTWIKRAFIADGIVVAVPNKGSDFALLRW